MATAADAAPITSSDPGNHGAIRRSNAMPAIEKSPTARATGLIPSRAAQSAGRVSTRSADAFIPVSPNRSLNWLTAMMIAMPTVKPSITGSGTRAMNRPARRSPPAKRMRPAMIVASSKPSNPCRSMTP